MKRLLLHWLFWHRWIYLDLRHRKCRWCPMTQTLYHVSIPAASYTNGPLHIECLGRESDMWLDDMPTKEQR